MRSHPSSVSSPAAAEFPIAGIEDERVEPAEARPGALGQLRRVLRFGDVSSNDDGVLEIDRDLVEQRAPPAREDDAVAVGGEPPRARRADAASRSRDDDGLHPRQPTR